MLIATLALFAGLAILTKGADWLVDGASSLARRWGISELAIGLTIVAFGTSIPELTVNLFSAFEGATEIAIGNIVGSNIANILLILGITAIIAPLKVQSSTVWKEIPFSLLAALLILIMANDHIVDGYPVAELSRSDGIALIAFFIIFLWYIFGMQGVDAQETDEHGKANKSVPVSLGFIVLGLAFLVGGGRMAVYGAVEIATLLGVSQTLIGLTIVAVGTSLPELVTSVVAARKGKADIAVGNIVGSNIFNIFWILGISAVILPLPFQPAMNTDLIIVVLSTLILFYAAHNGAIHRRFLFWKQRKGHKLEKIDGMIMLLGYIAYLAFLVWRG